MKQLLTIILLTLMSNAGYAATSSLSGLSGTFGRRAAQQKAAAVLGAEARLELAAVGEGDHPAYYIFNNQEAAKGFVIVAGDDGENDILGYSESGCYDAANLPPQLAFWLQCYEEQLDLVRRGEAAPYRTETPYPAIEPLVATHWDQQAPYNKQNPISPITNSRFPYVGCVATAMAQILKYWASDKPVADIPAYSYKLNSGGTIFTVNVDGLPATIFNYDLMRNNYSSADIDDGAIEVARLMAYCGRAAKMIYTTSSATTVTRGSYLSQYFGFNEHQVTESREYYSSVEWDSLLYQELQAGRPVMYSGARQDASKEQSGHAFLVDGYRDGLFHINWGWSGFYDGYFKLSECNPHGGGAGAGVGRDGYSFRQIAITRLTPGDVEAGHPRGGTAPTEGGLVVNGIDYEGTLRQNNEITLRINITNQGVAYYNRAYLFVDEKLTTGAGVMIDPGETDEVLMHIKLERGGTLALKLCGENDGSQMFWEGQLAVKSNRDPVLKFSEATLANVFDPVRRTISGRTFQATFTVTNEDSEPFEDPLKFVLYKGTKFDNNIAGEDVVEVSLASGESREMTVSFESLQVNSTYMLVARYYKYSDNTYQDVPVTKTYKILGGQSGVETVRCDTAVTDQEQYYDLQGRRVLEPKKGGIYIRRQQGTIKIAIP